MKSGKLTASEIARMGGKVKNPRKGFGSMTPEQRTAARLKGLEARRKARDVGKLGVSEDDYLPPAA